MTLQQAIDRNTRQRPGFPPRNEVIRYFAPTPDCAAGLHSDACGPRVTLTCEFCTTRRYDCAMTLAVVTAGDYQRRVYYCDSCGPRMTRKLLDAIFDGFTPDKFAPDPALT